MATPVPLSLEAGYRALDPQGALDPGAAAYTARPVPPLATLTTQLRLDHRPGLHLVSGHIGSGKTTELRRLEAELGPSARFVPLDSVSPEGNLSLSEVAAALLVASISMAEGLALEDIASSVQARRSLQATLARTTSSVKNVASALIGSVVGSSLRDFLHGSIKIENGHENERDAEEELVEAVRKASAQAQTILGTTPVVLLDGLDKLSLDEIEPALSRMQKWNLPLTLVAAVPLSYLFTPSFSRRESGFSGVHVVPALPVVGRDLQPNADGLAWFSNVLASRGVREIFDDDAVESLALMTAGIIRDFVRGCREAVLTALVQRRPRVDLETAKVALDEFALRMTRPVSGDDLRVLNVVAKTGRVVGHSAFLALIDGGQIVEYRNGANWYAVHPLLRDIVSRFTEELAS